MEIQNRYIEEILNKSEFYENENENFMSIKQKKIFPMHRKTRRSYVCYSGIIFSSCNTREFEIIAVRA